MCEDPNVWYTSTGEKVVGESNSNSEISAAVEDSVPFTQEVVLIDLSKGVIED